MGYTLTIGNAKLRVCKEDLRVDVDVDGFASDEAPTFKNDEMTGNTSSRSPSYTAWGEFSRAAGIEELFYGLGWDRDRRGYKECSDGFHREEGLLAHHPGVALLCQADLEYVKAAREKWQQEHPGTEPGFDGWSGESTGLDYTLARLLWLEFWIGYALANCEIPAFGNT